MTKCQGLRRIGWIVSVASLTATAPAQGVPPFYPAEQYGNFVAAWDLAAGDIDADGNLDVAVVGTDSLVATPDLHVHFGDGHGLLGEPVGYQSGFSAPDVELADLNGDGWLDLVSGAKDGPLVVELSTAPAAFAAPLFVASPPAPEHLLLLDLDGDGDLDIVAACRASSTLALHGNGGSGSFAAPALVPLGMHPVSLASADFDGDGNPDAAALATESALIVLDGDGEGALVVVDTLDVGQTGPERVAAGLLDADGDPDLAVTLDLQDAVVVVHGGSGDSFGTPVLVPLPGKAPGPVTVGDLNDDGQDDVVVGDRGSRDIAVLSRDARGNLAVAAVLPAGSVSQAVVIADLDGNGHSDLLTVDDPQGLVTVLLTHDAGWPQAGEVLDVAGSPGDARAADFDGDGWMDLVVTSYDTADVGLMFGQPDGSHAPAPALAIGAESVNASAADVDGDGLPDVTVSLPVFGRVAIVHGLGDGSFGPMKTYPVGPIADFAYGDFDGDGRLDLVSASGSTWGPRVIQQTASGDFAPALQVFGAYGPVAVDTADVNHDGWTDAVTANNPGQSVSYYVGGGPMLLSLGATLAAGDVVEDVALDDFDYDGYVDAAFALIGARSVGIKYGTALSVFGPMVKVYVGGNVRFVDTADLNGDMLPDIAAAAIAQDMVALVIGNKIGEFSAARNLATGWGPLSMLAGDVDGDGLADLVTACGDGGFVALLRQQGTWTQLPGALAWSGGSPLLAATGTPKPQAIVGLQLSHAPPAASTLVVVGLAPLVTPFRGGLLIPAPDLLLGPWLTDGDGVLTLAAHWPESVPAGLDLWLQAWNVQAGGFAASNGLVTNTH
jgi:FG-GAP-like repeat